MIATRGEFGVAATEASSSLGGLDLNEETQREMQAHRFRDQAVGAARETAYYKRLFDGLDLDPTGLRFEDIARIPLTSKTALRENPGAFVRQTAAPRLR